MTAHVLPSIKIMYKHLALTTQEQRLYDSMMFPTRVTIKQTVLKWHEQTHVIIYHHKNTVVGKLSLCSRYTLHFFPHCIQTRRFLKFADFLSFSLTPLFPRHLYYHVTEDWYTSFHPFILSCISYIRFTLSVIHFPIQSVKASSRKTEVNRKNVLELFKYNKHKYKLPDTCWCYMAQMRCARFLLTF